MIDSTTVRGHSQAAGAKGGLIRRLLVDHAAALLRKSTPTQTVEDALLALSWQAVRHRITTSFLTCWRYQSARRGYSLPTKATTVTFCGRNSWSTDQAGHSTEGQPKEPARLRFPGLQRPEPHRTDVQPPQAVP